MSASNRPRPNSQPNPDSLPVNPDPSSSVNPKQSADKEPSVEETRPVDEEPAAKPARPVDKGPTAKPTEPVDMAPAVEQAQPVDMAPTAEPARPIENRLPVEKKTPVEKKPPVEPPNLRTVNFPQRRARRSLRRRFEPPFFIKRAYYPIFGNARWPDFKTLKERNFVRPKDIKRGLFIHGATLILEDRAKNCCDIREGESLFLPEKILQTNVLTVGAVGGGKTQRVMYPLMIDALLHEDCSVVILGSKGDEASRISVICKDLCPNRRVMALNFSFASRSTVGWNPVATAAGKNPEAAAMEVGRVLTEADGVSKSESAFFRVGANKLIGSIIVALELETKKPARLAEVNRLINDISGTSELLAKAKALNVPEVNETIEFIRSGNTNVQTLLVEARNAMRAFVDDDVATVTSCDDFRFETLFDEPTVLVLESTQDATKTVQPLVNMFFSQFFSAVTARAKISPGAKLPRPVFVFLDDFAAAVGYIPDCAQKVNLMRSMDLRLILAIQTTRQLEQYYPAPEAESIVAACKTRIYVPTVEAVDAKKASEESGTATFAKRPQKPVKKEDSAPIGFLQSGRPRRAKAEEEEEIPDEGAYARALFLPDDVQRSPWHEDHGRAATIFLPDVDPFQAWLPFAYKNPEWARYFSQDAPTGVEPMEGSELKAALDDPNWIVKLRKRAPLSLRFEIMMKLKKSVEQAQDGKSGDKTPGGYRPPRDENHKDGYDPNQDLSGVF